MQSASFILISEVSLIKGKFCLHRFWNSDIMVFYMVPLFVGILSEIYSQ